jgi:hypothetical protein
VPRTLEVLVRDVVHDVVQRVERRVEELVRVELEAELARRRNGRAHVELENGDGPAPPALEPRRNGVDVVEPVDGDAPPPAKRCRTCGAEKPLAEFPFDGKTADGHRNVCRTCPQRRVRERRAELARAGDAEEPGPAIVPRRAREPRYDVTIASDDERTELLEDWLETGVVERR